MKCWQKLRLLPGLILLSACGPDYNYTPAEAKPRDMVHGWPEYGGGQGQRYAANTLINKENVGNLEFAWVYRTGDVALPGDPAFESPSAFELTPITAEGKLFLCTPFNRVVALDPMTGGEIWRYNPQIDMTGDYGNQFVCRGVSYWQDEDAAPGSHCGSRIFTATNDARLIALDAGTGEPCKDFGRDGEVNLAAQTDTLWTGEYQVTSPPAIISNLVVTGAAVADNVRTDAPSGVVRAFDARTGRQVWAFDLAPPGFDYESGLVSAEGFALGTPNVWAPMSVDQERDLLFLPTGNPAPDYYRPGEPEMDYYGTAVVALEGSTGRVRWHFNTVKHDFWDYDVASQPSLSDIEINGEVVPVVVQGTKMGFVFVLHRETGEPVVEVTWKDVAVDGPLSDQLSARQPFPPAAFQVSATVTPEDAWGLSPFERSHCETQFGAARTGDIYTPITETWTLVSPSHIGGINWGGVAVDPVNGRIFSRSSSLPALVKLIPRSEMTDRSGYEWGTEVAWQRGQPFGMARKVMLSPLGLPCSRPPWGLVTAIDISSESQAWRVPHGTVRDLSPVPTPLGYGVPGVGGPIVTSTGIVFLAGAFENTIRAYDADDGRVLWQERLPAGPQATPMTYTLKDSEGEMHSFVVIAAGGHGRAGTTMGDYLVAFSTN